MHSFLFAVILTALFVILNEVKYLCFGELRPFASLRVTEVDVQGDISCLCKDNGRSSPPSAVSEMYSFLFAVILTALFVILNEVKYLCFGELRPFTPFRVTEVDVQGDIPRLCEDNGRSSQHTIT